MAKDKNGVELKSGDLVTLTLEVTNVFGDDQYQNVTVQTVEKAPGASSGHVFGNLHSTQLEKVVETLPEVEETAAEVEAAQAENVEQMPISEDLSDNEPPMESETAE